MKFSSRQAGGIAVHMQPQAAVWQSCHRKVSQGDILMEEAFEVKVCSCDDFHVHQKEIY